MFGSIELFNNESDWSILDIFLCVYILTYTVCIHIIFIFIMSQFHYGSSLCFLNVEVEIYQPKSTLLTEDSKTELPAQPTHLLLGWNMLAKPFFFRTGRCGGGDCGDFGAKISSKHWFLPCFPAFCRGEERFHVEHVVLPEDSFPMLDAGILLSQLLGHSICCKRPISDIRGAKGMMMIDGIICRVLSAFWGFVGHFYQQLYRAAQQHVKTNRNSWKDDVSTWKRGHLPTSFQGVSLLPHRKTSSKSSWNKSGLAKVSHFLVAQHNFWVRCTLSIFFREGQEFSLVVIFGNGRKILPQNSVTLR